MLNYNKKLKQASQKLRGSTADAELLLWSKLKGKQLKGLQFYRQKIIGNYSVDFFTARKQVLLLKWMVDNIIQKPDAQPMLSVTDTCRLSDFEFSDIQILMY